MSTTKRKYTKPQQANEKVMKIKSLDIGMVMKRILPSKDGLVMYAAVMNGRVRVGWIGLTKEEFLSLDRSWQKAFIKVFSGQDVEKL